MTPPEASPRDNRPPAVSLRLVVLKNRPDFLAASRARRQAMPGFVLQARNRTDEDNDLIRIGYTCSKKVGNAVARNRAKRRLREVARQVLPLVGEPGWDYVLIGRHEKTATLPFDQLCRDMHIALGKLHRR